MSILYIVIGLVIIGFGCIKAAKWFNQYIDRCIQQELELERKRNERPSLELALVQCDDGKKRKIK